MPETVATLPDAIRGELKEPLGPLYTDVEALLDAASGPVIAVGDMVTYHLLTADRRPDVALVDGKTERTAVDREVTEAIGGFDRQLTAENPAATLTEDLLEALVDAIDHRGTVVISVDGEEDLAALPAVLAAPDGALVVYGQPGEGMVAATVDGDLRERSRDLLERMDGDFERMRTILEE